MKKILLFVLLLISLSVFGQTRYFINSNGKPQYYETIDTILYFTFNDTCVNTQKSKFLDSLTTISTLDTIDDNLYRLSFNNNNKLNLLSFFQSNITIKSYSFEYLNNDSVIHWTSGKIVFKN